MHCGNKHFKLAIACLQVLARKFAQLGNEIEMINGVECGRGLLPLTMDNSRRTPLWLEAVNMLGLQLRAMGYA